MNPPAAAGRARRRTLITGTKTNCIYVYIYIIVFNNETNLMDNKCSIYFLVLPIFCFRVPQQDG